MLKPIQTGNALPISFPVDPTAEFEAGMVAELKLLGNDVVAGVSSGLTPLGLIDDVKTRAMSQPAIDEEIILGPDLIGTPITDTSGQLVTAQIVTTTLQNPSIIKSSFTSSYPIIVNYKNGVLQLPTGSFLNYKTNPDPSAPLDSIRIITSYIYSVPDLPGVNSTLGSNRVTIWFQRGIWQTDQFDTTQGYPVNAMLFCGLDGRLTTKQPTPNHPGIAFVIGPPTANSIMLQFMWL